MGSFDEYPPVSVLKQMSDELAGRVEEAVPVPIQVKREVEQCRVAFFRSVDPSSRSSTVRIPIEYEVERLAEGIFYKEIREKYRKDQEEGLCKLTRKVSKCTAIITLEW